jgi:hypothetical protein
MVLVTDFVKALIKAGFTLIVPVLSLILTDFSVLGSLIVQVFLLALKGLFPNLFVKISIVVRKIHSETGLF